MMATQLGIGAASADIPVAKPRDHLAFIDGFRAIAIVAVVIGHCYALAFGPVRGGNFATNVVVNIASGNTALFVFISGLLLHHVFYARWDFGKFMKGKLTNVFFPYAVISLFLVFFARLGNQLPYSTVHSAGFATDNFYLDYGVSLLTGQLGPSLWYIPFVFIIFLASPLFLKFIEMQPRQRLLILAIALGIGLTINRSPQNIDKIQSVLYFSFYYLLGIEVSLRRQAVTELLSHRLAIPVTVTLLAAVACAEVAIQGVFGSYGPWFHLHEVNIHFLEKIVLIFLCMAAFVQVPRWNGGWMKRLAQDSFGIFFLHNLFIGLFIATFGAGTSITGVKAVDIFLYGFIVLALSWLMVAAIKQVAGARSRMLIGA